MDSSSSEYTYKAFDAKLMNETMKEVHVKSGTKFDLIGEVQFQRSFLDAQNMMRARYGCGDLSWAEDLSKLANVWAQKIADQGVFLYEDISSVGQNITILPVHDFGELPSAEDIVARWEKEAAIYYDRPKQWSVETQRFTQLVWRETREVGAARMLTSGSNGLNTLIIVSFYRPAGNNNRPGHYQRNVPAIPKL